MQSQLPPIQTRNLQSPGRKRFSHLSTLSERTDLLLTPATARSTSRLSQWTDTDSFAALVPQGEVENVREQLRLNLDEQEAEDVGIVAEHARPGSLSGTRSRASFSQAQCTTSHTLGVRRTYALSAWTQSWHG